MEALLFFSSEIMGLSGTTMGFKQSLVGVIYLFVTDPHIRSKVERESRSKQESSRRVCLRRLAGEEIRDDPAAASPGGATPNIPPRVHHASDPGFLVWELSEPGRLSHTSDSCL